MLFQIQSGLCMANKTCKLIRKLLELLCPTSMMCRLICRLCDRANPIICNNPLRLSPKLSTRQGVAHNYLILDLITVTPNTDACGAARARDYLRFAITRKSAGPTRANNFWLIYIICIQYVKSTWLGLRAKVTHREGDTQRDVNRRYHLGDTL